MKTYTKAIAALVLMCLFTACSVTYQYYQISQTTPVDKSIIKNDNDDSGYYYQDPFCRITYNFWSEKGNAGFTVTNLTNQILYIVKDKCFFIKNGVSYDYYHGEEWNSPATAGQPVKNTKESNLIGIPPRTSRTISEYPIYTYIYVDCDLDRKPMLNRPVTMSFTRANSPVEFGNFITYKLGEQGTERSVTHMFYTSRVTNYRKDDIVYTEKKEYCPNVSDLKMYQDSILRFAPTTGYYIKYVK